MSSEDSTQKKGNEMSKFDAYYDDTIDEWVAVSQLTGREYFGQTCSEAEYNRAEDERVYGDHHRKAVVQ